MKSKLLLCFLLLALLFSCKKEENFTSKTNLLCKTWIWSDENDQNWKTYMTFHVDGTAVIEDINLTTNYSAYFNYTWKWGDKNETLLVTTSIKSGSVDHSTVIKISDKELVLKDESGAVHTIKAR